MRPPESMNCKEYKESIAADPSESFAGGGDHSAACSSCADYRDGMRALDEQIARALVIDVPQLEMPELPPVAEDDGNVVSLPFGKKRLPATPMWLGLAAGVALAAVIGVRFMAYQPTYDSLADEIIAHMGHEPNSRVVTDEPVSDGRLERVIRTRATLDDRIGLISYARSCVIHGRTIPHLVIQGKNGPITVLLMPEEHIEETITLDAENVHGYIIPVGDGSIAIIGERLKDVGDIRNQVVDSVTWSI